MVYIAEIKCLIALTNITEINMNIFNKKEFQNICDKLNAQPVIMDRTLKFDNSGYFNKLKNSIEHDRRGEAAFCVIRPSGKIIVVTCKEYPAGIYRIPTGGIGYGEDIVSAVFREAKEELGLETAIEKFCGVIRIRFEHRGESLMFYSYLFILKEVSGNLLADASDDEVSEVREVDLTELEEISRSLNNISGKWRDWGRFRHLTTEAVREALRE